MRFLERGNIPGGYNNGKVGDTWMIHNYYKVQDFQGNLTASTAGAMLAMIAAALPDNKTLGGIGADGQYHVYGCASPEYTCFPPFDSDKSRNPSCHISQDCNYALASVKTKINILTPNVLEDTDGVLRPPLNSLISVLSGSKCNAAFSLC